MLWSWSSTFGARFLPSSSIAVAICVTSCAGPLASAPVAVAIIVRRRWSDRPPISIFICIWCGWHRVPRRRCRRRFWQVQGHRVCARCIKQQLVEAACPCITFGKEGSEVEEILDCCRYGCQIKLRCICWPFRLLKDHALSNPRRHQESSRAQAKTAEIEIRTAPRVMWHSLTVNVAWCVIGGHTFKWWYHMVVKAACVVVRN